jgi:hypothetical protein
VGVDEPRCKDGRRMIRELDALRHAAARSDPGDAARLDDDRAVLEYA